MRYLSLYEPDARFVAPSGETLIGHDRIRQVIGGLIQSKTKMKSRVLRAITLEDVAVLYTDFDGTTEDASGKTVELRSRDRSASPAAGWQLETHCRRSERTLALATQRQRRGFMAEPGSCRRTAPGYRVDTTEAANCERIYRLHQHPRASPLGIPSRGALNFGQEG